MQKVWQAILFSCLALAVACGDDSSKTKDLCAGVECAGTCDAATGTCVDECVTNDDCSEGVCDNGSCVVDLCADVTCDRGICAVATGMCVNSDVCAAETETIDCLDGFTCYGQRCVSDEEYCSNLTCDRGVCSASEKACANASSCVGDTECLAGFFCDDGTCAQNVCDADMVMCARGECEGTTGECIDAETCTLGTQCLDGKYCVDGTCEDTAAACAACEGNQVCEYDQATTVTCVEASFCNNTADCLGDRICEAGACVEAGTCVNDALEPFDLVAPSAIAEGAGFIAATICGADEDAFSYDTLADSQFTGALSVVVQLAPEHVGRGELALDLVDAGGTSVATGTTVNGVARLTKSIGNLDGGVYTVSVKGAGVISAAGIDYSVSMDLLDATTVAACGTPTALAATQTGNTLSGASLGLSPSCATTGAPAEDIFAFDIAAESVVTLTLTPANGADLLVSLRTACEVDLSELACVNDNANQEQFVGRLTPGRYFAVVQAASANSGGEYTLTYSAVLPVCSQADNSCADINVAQICNDAGTGFNNVTCEQGCNVATGRCSRAESDVCYTAVDASNGYSGVIDWDLLTNDFEPESACVPGTGTTDGPDAAFFVTLPPMSALTVELVSNDYDDLSIYLVRNCDDLERTCFAGVDASGDETLTYVNTRATAESFYVIADVEDFYYDTAEINIAVAPVICTPAAATCLNGVLDTCNPSGTAYISKNCGFGCDVAATGCALPTNDVCGAGAIDISAGGAFAVDTTDYVNDYALTSSNCTGYSSNGNDAVYQLSGQPGDVVDIEFDTTFDASLYVLTDCANFNSCLDGSDSGNPEDISFVLTDTNPVYVVVDGYSATSKGAGTLNVTIRQPDCTTYGEAVTCLSGTELQYCSDVGFLETYTCDGACSNGACATPTGDVCWDTIPILSGGTATGNFDDLNNLLDPGASCILSADPAQDGGEAIYTITLFPGETLVADLTTTSATAGMYVLSSCSSNSCEYGISNAKHLEYYSATGGDFFLVVDNTSTFSTADYTLNVSTRVGDVCQPGGATCDLAGNLTVCSDDGLSTLGTYTCPNGCTAGFCDAPAAVNDTCATAMPISSDIRLRQSFGAVTANYNPGSAGCTGNSLGGPDAVYAITLAPGQVVEATVQSFDTFNAPAIYFVSDCSDVTTTCLEGQAGTNDRAKFGYYSALGETVYMVVDTQYSSTDAFVLDVEFKAQECTPATALCSGPDTLSTCNSYGLYDESDCYFGCAAGACSAAPNDLCSGAIDVGLGGSFQGEISLFTNNYNPLSTGCTGYAEVGPDAAYVVTAPAGDIVEVDVTMDFNIGLYILTDCGNMSTCLEGVDDYDTANLVVVSTGAPLYIIVDSYSATASGNYDMTVGVRTPECAPATKTCSDANTLSTCNTYGFYEDTACSFGCAVDACNPATNDVCGPGALDVSAGGTFMLNTSMYQNDYNLPGTGCTGYATAGKDAVFQVSGQPGDVVDVTLNATFDAALYALTDCSMLSTCIDGSDTTIGGLETIQFVLTDTNPVYVVADTWSASASGAMTLNVTINAP